MNHDHFMRTVNIILEIMTEVQAQTEKLDRKNFDQMREELKGDIATAGMLMVVLKENI